jgi:hypothetical protein
MPVCNSGTKRSSGMVHRPFWALYIYSISALWRPSSRGRTEEVAGGWRNSTGKWWHLPRQRVSSRYWHGNVDFTGCLISNPRACNCWHVDRMLFKRKELSNTVSENRGLMRIFGSNTDHLTKKQMMIMSMGWDYVSELRPPTGLLLIPHVIYEYGELRWNDIDLDHLKMAVKSRNM